MWPTLTTDVNASAAEISSISGSERGTLSQPSRHWANPSLAPIQTHVWSASKITSKELLRKPTETETEAIAGLQLSWKVAISIVQFDFFRFSCQKQYAQKVRTKHWAKTYWQKSVPDGLPHCAYVACVNSWLIKQSRLALMTATVHVSSFVFTARRIRNTYA